ncbi:PilZ domain-containing protein [Pseudooceanicola sp.]|uniref:PilZ domain-containing protein n=1 Tax=Pseudooceanicola sp. TaxID=1914328 RepID=UPI0040590F03
MLSSAAFADTNRRRHTRYPVDLACQVTFTDRTLHARVRDISLGGARLHMPLTAAHYDFDRLTTLDIRRIGLVRVRWRWSEDHLVGVEFASPDLIRQSLASVIAEQAGA